MKILRDVGGSIPRHIQWINDGYWIIDGIMEPLYLNINLRVNRQL